MKKRIPFFSALVETRTYLNLVYVLIAFPLSVVYFSLVVTGISISFGLLVIAIGFFAFIGTLLMIRAFRWLDVQLTGVFLGKPIRIKPWKETRSENFGAFLKKLFGSSTTWKGFVYYLLIKLPLDSIIWGISIAFIASTLELLLAPVLQQYWWFEGEDLAVWLTRFFGEVWVLPFLGIIWGMITLHVIRGLAWVSRELNAVMLSD